MADRYWTTDRSARHTLRAHLRRRQGLLTGSDYFQLLGAYVAQLDRPSPLPLDDFWRDWMGQSFDPRQVIPALLTGMRPAERARAVNEMVAQLSSMPNDAQRLDAAGQPVPTDATRAALGSFLGALHPVGRAAGDGTMSPADQKARELANLGTLRDAAAELLNGRPAPGATIGAKQPGFGAPGVGANGPGLRTPGAPKPSTRAPHVGIPTPDEPQFRAPATDPVGMGARGPGAPNVGQPAPGAPSMPAAGTRSRGARYPGAARNASTAQRRALRMASLRRAGSENLRRLNGALRTAARTQRDRLRRVLLAQREGPEVVPTGVGAPGAFDPTVTGVPAPPTQPPQYPSAPAPGPHDVDVAAPGVGSMGDAPEVVGRQPSVDGTVRPAPTRPFSPPPMPTEKPLVSPAPRGADDLLDVSTDGPVPASRRGPSDEAIASAIEEIVGRSPSVQQSTTGSPGRGNLHRPRASRRTVTRGRTPPAVPQRPTPRPTGPSSRPIALPGAPEVVGGTGADIEGGGPVGFDDSVPAMDGQPVEAGTVVEDVDVERSDEPVVARPAPGPKGPSKSVPRPPRVGGLDI
jgi:hypothetical protein